MATVPINDATTRAVYTATAAQTSFAYTWWIKEDTDLDVYLNDTLQTLTTDYTVSATQVTTGANVVLVTGASADDEIIIVYNPAIERQSEFQTSGQFLATSLNLELTYLVSLNQYLSTQIDRAFRLSDSDAATSAILPELSTNAGGFTRVNTEGTALEFATVASSAVVVNSYDSERHSGTGAETDFTLGFTPAAQNSVMIWVTNVRQFPGVDYTISGDTLSFTVAPASASNNIEVLNLADSTSPSVPTDASVTTAKLATNAVTTVKITDANVTTAKIADANVTLAKMANIDGTTNAKVVGRTTTGAGVPELVGMFDEDDLSSDSDIALATQQSIKAYVDAFDDPGLARAWANINMTNTTINDSYNVSSLTDVGLGDGDINYTSNMASTSHVAVVSINASDTGTVMSKGHTIATTHSTWWSQLSTANTAADAPKTGAVFGDLA